MNRFEISKMKRLKDRIKKSKILYAIFSIPYAPVRLLHAIQQYLRDRTVALEKEDILRSVSPSCSNIFYIGVPHHMNVGDMAQSVCIRKWLADNYPDRNVIELYTECVNFSGTYNILKEKIQKDNLIVFQSGYTSHEKHPDHIMHLKLVKDFPENTFLFMPQTVNITTNRMKKKVRRLFNDCRSLLFLARDPVSYNQIKEIADKIQILLYPDIVTTMIGTRECKEDGSGALLCLRNDDEKAISEKSTNEILEFLNSAGVETKISDTTLSGMKYSEFVREFDNTLSGIIEEYAGKRLIITDRYHGTIFAAISGTPVIVVATKDHKVVSGAQWLISNNVSNVYLTTTTEEVMSTAEMILKQSSVVPAVGSDVFNKSYYAKLKEIVEEINNG